jgi:hypothetical protein
MTDSIEGVLFGDGRCRCSKWLATHGCVNGIEDAQAIDIRRSTNGDRIA